MNAHFEAAPALDEDLAHMDQEFAADEGKPINGAAPAFGITWVRDLVPNLQCRDLIKDILPGHGIGEVHADSSGGKTAIVIDMMMHLAEGREYRTRRTLQTPVIYIALEGHAGIDNRVIAAAAELAVDTATIEFGLIRSKENFRDPEVVAKLGAALIAIGRPCVVVIDTYQAALGAGGNDCRPEDVTAFLQNVKVHLLGHRHTVLIPASLRQGSEPRRPRMVGAPGQHGLRMGN
jgi:hypothetical protein